MVQQSRIGFAVFLQRFFPVSEVGQNVGFVAFVSKPAMQTEKILTVKYQLIVYAVEKTFGIAQVVNRIQNIGFTDTIGSGNAIESGAKFQIAFAVVLEIEYLQAGEMHGAKLMLLRVNSLEILQ
jgi:hypothetical protein